MSNAGSELELLRELFRIVKGVVRHFEHGEPLSTGTLQRLIAIVERVEGER